MILLVGISRLVANTRRKGKFGDAIKSIPSDYRLLALKRLILCPVSLWWGCCPVGFLDFVISILLLLGLYYFSVLFFISALIWFYSFCVFNCQFLLRHTQLIVLTTNLKYVRLFLSFLLIPLNVYVYTILRIDFRWARYQIYFIFCLTHFLTIFYWLWRCCWNQFSMG